MKSFRVDAIMHGTWSCNNIIGFLLILLGTRQSKKEFDIDNMPYTRPTTKIIFGTFFIIIGGIQYSLFLN